MILDDFVSIGMSPLTKSHFEKLGYVWLGQGVKTDIKVKHLLPTCRVFVNIMCDECGKKYKQQYIYRLKTYEKFKKDLCSSCVHAGNRNQSYGKDRSSILRYARTFQKVNGMAGRKHKNSSKQIMSKKRIEYIKSHKSYYPNCRKYKYKSLRSNIWFIADSKLEVYYMNYLDTNINVEYWKKNTEIYIEYMYKNTIHRYIPDFIVKFCNLDVLYIIETKGAYTNKDKIKGEYAIQYCNKNNFKYMLVLEKDVILEYRRFLKNWSDFKNEFGVL